MKSSSEGHSITASEHQYDCPMKCEGDKKYNEAGRCPVCGMHLVKVEGQAGSAHKSKQNE